MARRPLGPLVSEEACRPLPVPRRDHRSGPAPAAPGHSPSLKEPLCARFRPSVLCANNRNAAVSGEGGRCGPERPLPSGLRPLSSVRPGRQEGALRSTQEPPHRRCSGRWAAERRPGQVTKMWADPGGLPGGGGRIGSVKRGAQESGVLPLGEARGRNGEVRRRPRGTLGVRGGCTQDPSGGWPGTAGRG